jgi:DNA (cytosine-5)-methyltransferase 1
MVTDYTAIAIFAGGNGAGAGLSYSESIAPTLKAAGAAINQAPTIAFGFKSYGQYEETETSKTLMACDDITTGDLIANVKTGKTVRRLTPLECERLQGYPDGWTKYGHDGKEIKDSPRYTAIGNSLALPCVEYLISGIAAIARQHTLSEAEADKIETHSPHKRRETKRNKRLQVH